MWNYRICKTTNHYKIGEEDGKTIVYAIHEAYYNEKGEIWAVTEHPKAALADVSPWNFTDEAHALTGLAEQLELFAQALTRPVVDLDTIVYAENN